MKIKPIRIFIISALMLTFLCVGCGKKVTDEEKQLADFSKSMANFTETIMQADQKLNNIDTEKEGASKEMLTILEDIDKEIIKVSELSIPDQYGSVKKLATEAHEQMTNALSYFHSAYDSDTFIKQDADIAFEYYTRAMRRIRAIGYVLSGEIPEEQEGMSFHEEENDSRLINKILPGEN